MELASRIYAVVTRDAHLSAEVTDLLPELKDPDVVRYWRRVLRMAALCHDLGHLPFLDVRLAP
jgi:HD superfamily phosphohydrolase